MLFRKGEAEQRFPLAPKYRPKRQRENAGRSKKTTPKLLPKNEWPEQRRRAIAPHARYGRGNIFHGYVNKIACNGKGKSLSVLSYAGQVTDNAFFLHFPYHSLDGLLYLEVEKAFITNNY